MYNMIARRSVEHTSMEQIKDKEATVPTMDSSIDGVNSGNNNQPHLSHSKEHTHVN